MALFRRKKMKKEMANQQDYLKYYNRLKSAGKTRQALSYAQWQKSQKVKTLKPMKRKIKPTTREFKTTRTRDIEGQLKRSGLTEEEIRRLRGK